ncbi:MAG: DUF2336 domain-containing protein [Pseudomonadota bacterium]
MYTSLLEKSPQIGPLLVRLYDRQKLHMLSEGSGDETRNELASIMADLLNLELAPTESEMITDVLIGLLNQAEIDLRASLAERLATMDDIPLRMVLHLANDEAKVAAPVLKGSKSLTDTDLVYIVKAKSTGHWQAIAQRSSLSEALMKALVDTKDLRTAITLSENQNIILTPYAIERFTKMTRHSDELAKSFVERDEIPEDVITKIYQFVGRALKDHIREHFYSASADISDLAVDDIVSQMSLKSGDDLTPPVGLVIEAENMMEKGMLTPEAMIDNLRRSQILTFVAQFSIYAGIDVSTVRQILAQKSAQGLAVASKATNIQKHEFVNLYLLTHKFRSEGEQIVDKTELGLALKYFDTVTKTMAREILNESRH